jgi:tRNA pseudouridine38-40 synthase
MRFFIDISYLGTHYAGWQIQDNALTVQEIINEALSTILNQPLNITGAGRTDAGVHCRQTFAHFDIQDELPPDFLKRINLYLPKEICIKNVFKVIPGSHARFDAMQRDYVYKIHLKKDPFLINLSYYYPYPNLDFEKMKAAAKVFLKFKDYSILSKFNKDNTSTICEISKSELIIEDDVHLKFIVQANRFLHNMVRRMTGAILSVGNGKLDIEELKTALNTLQPLRFNLTVPPEGLYLTGVHYPFPLIQAN